MNELCTQKLPQGGVCGRIFAVADEAARKKSRGMCKACRSRLAKVGHLAMVRKHGYGAIPAMRVKGRVIR